MDLVYSRNPDVVFRQIADEYILVPIRQNAADLNSIYTLNPVAAFVWELIDGKRPISDILSHLFDAYDVTKEAAQEDLFSFVGLLEKIDVIKLVRK